MRNPAAQGRPDANQADIISVYESAMCSVVDLSGVGGGLSDLLIGCATPTGRKMALVEVKTEKGTLTPAQRTFHAQWRGPPPRIIRSPEEAVAHLRELRGAP